MRVIPRSFVLQGKCGRKKGLGGGYGAVVFKVLAFAGSLHNYIIMDEDDWLSGDQKTAERKIAEREFIN